MTKLSSVLLLVLAACGGNVVVDGTSGASATTGGGGAMGTSVGGGTSFGPTGAGGSQGTSTGTVTAATTSVGAGGSTTTSCTGTFFQLTAGDATFMLDSSCSGQSSALPVPYGQKLTGGQPNNPGSLTIEGCESSAANSVGIAVYATAAFAPGTYALFGVDSFGATSPGDLPGTLTVSAFGPVGGTISGSFEFGQAPNTVEGKFTVCRAPDVIAP